MRIVALLWPLLIAGCSATGLDDWFEPSDAGTGDARVLEAAAPDAVDSGMSYPAAHPALPQVLTLGGPVMTAPKIVGLTFAGDDQASKISQFVASIGAPSAYWTGATAEYGVGPIASTTTIATNQSVGRTITDTDVKAWLKAALAASADAGAGGSGGSNGGPMLPPPDANTEYVLFYPASVTVLVPGGVSCAQFLGYHDDFAFDGGFVSYAVVPRCQAGPDISAIDAIAMVASHEMIEVATDPFPTDRPAWSLVDQDHLAWAMIAGPEIGDLCAVFPDSFYKPDGLPYLVQRVWSNKAAAASHDPCEPEGSSPYFNAAAVLDDTITVGAARLGAIAVTKGVKIPVGQSRTVELDLFTDQPTSGPMIVTAIDLDAQYLQPLELSFAFDKTQGQNGDKIQMTITVVAAGQGGVEPFWVQASLGEYQAVWLGLVGN